MKRLMLTLLLVWPVVGVSEELKVTSKVILENKKGFLTCTGGGSQNPLFNRECSKLMVARVFLPGAMKYEIKCVDSNQTEFVMACDAFSFENTPFIGNRTIK